MYNPFPPTSQALDEPNGLLASGGDLSADTLLRAYAQGIFPWFESDREMLWWTPDPRMIIRPAELHVSKSLKKTIRKNGWRIHYDTNFKQVLLSCASVPRKQDEVGTWITQEMSQAYQHLHSLGVAHSIEIYDDKTLIGGLYGLMLGRVFFGESMFSRASNASKVALVALARLCMAHGIEMIDCQVHNPHLESLGASLVTRKDFEKYLREAIKEPMSEILQNPACLLPERVLPVNERLSTPLPYEAASLL
ncbi:MAG: leucyl/phenylalanyl-tRNA--protein transferase [Luminiphilus sp.]|nr:leucyl/phenylalanyl-tRNA--protein transferase [Luminiphilus sp.]